MSLAPSANIFCRTSCLTVYSLKSSPSTPVCVAASRGLLFLKAFSSSTVTVWSPTFTASSATGPEAERHFLEFFAATIRNPHTRRAYARGAADRGLHVIVAGAGGAAHLPVMLAAKTPVPVLGVPVASLAALTALPGVASVWLAPGRRTASAADVPATRLIPPAAAAPAR